MIDEPNVEVETDASTLIDNALDSHFDGEQETPSDSSTEKETTPEETEESKDAGADQPEKANPEETKEETEEEADPKDLMFRKGYNEAKAKSDKELQEAQDKLSKFSDFELKMEKFEKVTNSPTYIKSQMREEGYTEEAINSKLQEMGHTVEEPTQDDVKLVLNELGVTEDSIDPALKNTISDIAKIADIIARDRLNKTVPQQLQGVEDKINQMTQTSSADKVLGAMQSTVKDEGILDFGKDVEPIIGKYLQENPNASQQEVLAHFHVLNHKMTIERLKLGKKQEARNESKSGNRQNTESDNASPTKISGYDGKKPFGDHLDDVLDKMGVQW